MATRIFALFHLFSFLMLVRAILGCSYEHALSSPKQIVLVITQKVEEPAWSLVSAGHSVGLPRRLVESMNG